MELEWNRKHRLREADVWAGVGAQGVSFGERSSPAGKELSTFTLPNS